MSAIEIKNPFSGQETHLVRFYIKPSRKRLFVEVRIPMLLGNTEEAEKLLTENYKNRGHNPLQRIGGKTFSAFANILGDAMDILDVDTNREFGIVSINKLA